MFKKYAVFVVFLQDVKQQLDSPMKSVFSFPFDNDK